MEILRINNKENLINNYGLTPTLPFDIEGTLVEKNGKDIKVQKTIDNKVVEYSLRLKQEIVEDLGENVKVDKDNILASKVEEKEEKAKDNQARRKVADILLELGLEYTEENLRMVEFLLKSGIRITRENVDSYKKSREYLSKIVEEIDMDSYTKLMNRGIDLEVDNLQKIAEALEDIKNERNPFSLRRFLRLDKDLTNEEAEEIAIEIYGQRTGKDVYDAIKALHKEKLSLTKENIEKIMETMSKVRNLKEINSETYVEILHDEIDFNIENLYRISKSYSLDRINTVSRARDFEVFTIGEEVNINSIGEILNNLELDNTRENINILREFLVNDMDIDREKYERVISMKDAVRELVHILKPENIANLNKRGINPLEEDIHSLLYEINNEDKTLELGDLNEEAEAREIMEGLESLGLIKDKDLLTLVKTGLDFNLKTIREIIKTEAGNDIIIDNKTFEKTIHLTNNFNSLGEELHPGIINMTLNRFNHISLENLATVEKEIDINQGPITGIEGKEESLIFQEYIKARNSLTVSMVKESIEEGRSLEHMALTELNEFIDKKINKYENISKMSREIKELKGREGEILPLVIKNNLSMNLGEIRKINSLLSGERNLANILKDILDPKNSDYEEGYKENIKLLQEKISSSIKNGDGDLKDDYRELMNIFKDPSGSSNQREDRPRKEYIETIDKISKKDMIIQLPVEIDNDYKSLNIIVPDMAKGVDKNNMNFYIGLNTDRLGTVKMEIQVKGREIYISIDEEGRALKDNISLLEEKLKKSGYIVNKEVVL